MITPTFTISQQDDFVIVVIKAPYIKTQNVDFEIDGAVFKFNVKPYFLRLTFPGNIVEDDRATASYNIGSGELTVTLPKETPGQHFEDLDMLTRLLVRKGDLDKTNIKRPLIEVVGSETLEGTEKIEKDEEFDWEMPQEIKQEIISEVRYGFNNRYSGFFTHVQETANDVLDVFDPEHSDLETRRQNRIQRENEKFDDEYYMSEFMIEEEIQHILKYKTPWWNELKSIQNSEKANTSNKEKKSPATIIRDKKSLITPIESTSTSTRPNTQAKPSIPSILYVNKDSDEPSTSSNLDSIGMKEVSSRNISSINNEPTQKKSLIMELEPTESVSNADISIAPEPLIDESEPIKHLSGETITIIDPSKSSSTGNRLENSMENLSISNQDTIQGSKPFSSKEQELMRDLPRREYILENTKSTYLGLIDIIFAYSYDLRVSEGDSNVETAWTICKLSPTIAALEQFTTLKETLLASFRRSLAYPLNRNWNLSIKVLQDVYVIFKLGRRGILRALLAIKDILDHDDVYYIYSKMFIEDYCVWIQSASEKVIKTLAHELHHFQIEKSELGWHLEELEALAKETPVDEEEEEEEEEEEDDDDDDDDSSEDEDDASSDDDSSSSSDEDSDDDLKKDSDKSEKDDLRENENDSIFMQEGPRPLIIEL